MEEKKEIDLKGLAKDIFKRVWIIILCAVIFGTAMLIYTVNFVTPTYKASVTFYVNNNSESTSNSVSSSNLAVALQLTKSYVNIIQSDRVLEKVVQEARFTELTAANIRQMMNVEIMDETEMFRVSIISPNPKMSADIANAIAEHAPGEIRLIIEGSNAKVVDKATAPERRHAPNYTTSAVLGALVGAALSTLIIAIFILSDNRIKDAEDLTRVCQLPVLGMIPDFLDAAKHTEKPVEKKGVRRTK